MFLSILPICLLEFRRHLRLLVWPWPLCCDWSHQSIPLLTSFADVRVALPFWTIYAFPFGLLKISQGLDEETSQNLTTCQS